MNYLIMDAATAKQIVGKTSATTELVPVQLKDGSFILPDVVLSDPAHQARKATLQPLPGKTKAELVFKDPEPRIAKDA